MSDALSTRGRRLITEPPIAEYIRTHIDSFADEWHAEANPDGYIGLCVAENKLVWDLLEPRLNEPRMVPAEAVAYNEMIGMQQVRGRLADFLSRTVLGRPIEPRHLAVLGGAGSVLELLFHAIADPGDAVLVPTPSYAGFWSDLETRDQLTIVPVHTSSADGFDLRVDQLEAAYQAADRPVRALLFSSPSNPLGRVCSPAVLEDVLGWAESKEIHVAVDELFALSVFGDATFVSAAELRPRLGDRLHLIWAASKDLAMSGLRCGVLISDNQEVIESVDALAMWACVSGDTQHLIGELVADGPWIDGFLAESRRRLGTAYAATTTALEEAGIQYLPGEAAFFFLVDVRPFLGHVTWEEEDALWRRFVAEAKVNLTPGSACRIGEPGFMRLCFAGTPPEVTVEAVRRLARLLR